MLSTNYYCTINKTEDNQLVLDVCLLVMGSKFLQAKALHQTCLFRVYILKKIGGVQINKIVKVSECTSNNLFLPTHIISKLISTQRWVKLWNAHGAESPFHWIRQKKSNRRLSSLCLLMELCKKAFSSTSYKALPVSQTPSVWRIIVDLNQNRGNQSAWTLRVEGTNWMILALCGLWPGLSA